MFPDGQEGIEGSKPSFRAENRCGATCWQLLQRLWMDAGSMIPGYSSIVGPTVRAGCGEGERGISFFFFSLSKPFRWRRFLEPLREEEGDEGNKRSEEEGDRELASAITSNHGCVLSQAVDVAAGPGVRELGRAANTT